MLLLSLNSRFFNKQGRLAALTLPALWLVCPAPPQAAEWSLLGNLKQDLGYDDNVFMRSGKNRHGSFEYKIIPTLTFAHKTDISEVTANASYGTQVYTSPIFDALNQDIQNYGLNGLYKTNRLDWGFAWDYAKTPTRNNAQSDSGNFAAGSTSDRWQVAPSVTYRLSELDTLTLAPSYSESSFEKSSGTGFRDYNTKNVNLTWQHIWTERYSTSLSGFYSNFDSQQGKAATDFGGTQQVTYDSFGLNMTNAYKWSDRWNLNGTIGVRETESQANSKSSSSFGFLANATVDYTGENYGAGIFFSRSIAPSNQGFLQEQTNVGLNANYRFTDNLSASMNTGYLSSTQIGTGSNRTRENIVFNPSLNWNISPDWMLVGSYRYRSQDRNFSNNYSTNAIDSSPTSSYSDLFMFTINYNWQGIKASK